MQRVSSMVETKICQAFIDKGWQPVHAYDLYYRNKAQELASPLFPGTVPRHSAHLTLYPCAYVFDDALPSMAVENAAHLSTILKEEVLSPEVANPDLVRDDSLAPQRKKQKRNKPTLSCEECVERKTKVSRGAHCLCKLD
jgi:hypothetical protein